MFFRRQPDNRRQSATRPRKRQLWWVVLVMLGGSALLAAGRFYTDLTAANLPSVRGVLLDVRASSRTITDGLTLRDEAGNVWEFDVSPEVLNNDEEPQTASHLRQHMALVDPVIVRYRSTDTGPIAVRVSDAS